MKTQIKKILAIGDIHEKECWKKIVENESFDQVVFMADYVDSFERRGNAISNLMDIIEFKRKNSDKVVLLLGNHDAQYLHIEQLQYRCSGFQNKIGFALNQIFNEYRNLFCYAHQVDNYLFTHAGVTQKFAELLIQQNMEYVGTNSWADFINLVGKTKNEKMFNMCGRERGGNDVCSGLLWTGKDELKRDPMLGFHQIIGHTWSEKIEIHNTQPKLQNGFKIYFIDALRDEIENKPNENYLFLNL